MNAPLYLARSGRVIGGSIYLLGGSGFYWSSTVNSSESARYINFKFDYIDPESNNLRHTGIGLRCVLREFLIVSPKAQPTADQVSVSANSTQDLRNTF